MKIIVFKVPVHRLSDQHFAELLDALAANLGKYAERLSIAASEMRVLEDAALIFQWIMETPVLLKSQIAELHHFRKQQRCITRYETLPALPEIKVPQLPKGVRAAGDLNKMLTSLIRKIKLSPQYTEGIGAELGLSDFGVIVNISEQTDQEL